MFNLKKREGLKGYIKKTGQMALEFPVGFPVQKLKSAETDSASQYNIAVLNLVPAAEEHFN